MNAFGKVALWVCGIPVALFFGSAIVAGISESVASKNEAQTEIIPVTAKLEKGKAYERYALSNSLRGVSAEVLQDRLGKPDSTQSSGRQEYWYYSNVSWDYAAKKLDRQMQVVLDLGTVKSVNFY